MARREKKNATLAWLERSNPLAGLSVAAARAIFDAARGGDTQRLHWIYQEIEAQNPVLSMAVTRRSGAAANFRWRVAERAAMDGALSAEQKNAAEIFLGRVENLGDLFEHLDLALFRGFAHAQPIWEDERTVRRIELLDSWKFLKKDGEWFFNPVCDGFSSNCVPCQDARLVTVERRRPVDVPALSIHLRAAVGSRDWGRFIERYALPKPAVVMAPNATNDDRDSYLESAEGLENGQVTVWPSGASLMDFAGSSRGVDPFTSFIQHQEKTILMLATGGTLGSMAESGAGTLAGNAQQDVWEQIVARDAGVIAQAVMRSLLKPYLAAEFPGRPAAVDFFFDLSAKPTPKEIFETAAAARNAGYLVAQDVLEAETGWKLEKAPEQPSPAPGFAMNSRPTPKTPLQTREKPLQNSPGVSDGQGDLPGENALTEALEAMFAKSLAEAAADEAGRADLRVGRDGARPSQDVANTIDANGMEHDELGRFGEGGGVNPDSVEVKTKEISRGRAALEKCLSEGVDVRDAVKRGDLGSISLVYGDETGGLAHFKDRKDAVEHLIDTLVEGRAGNPYQHGQKRNIVRGGYTAVLRTTGDAKAGLPENWVLTAFGPSDKKRKEA